MTKTIVTATRVMPARLSANRNPPVATERNYSASLAPAGGVYLKIPSAPASAGSVGSGAGRSPSLMSAAHRRANGAARDTPPGLRSFERTRWRARRWWHPIKCRPCRYRACRHARSTPTRAASGRTGEHGQGGGIETLRPPKRKPLVWHHVQKPTLSRVRAGRGRTDSMRTRHKPNGDEACGPIRPLARVAPA